MTRPRIPARGLVFAGAVLAALLLPSSVLAATIVGTPGNNLLVGTPRSDSISGLGGNDLVLGAGGADIIDGGPGADALFGGAGTDTLIGGDGPDALVGGTGSDVFDGGTGNDHIVAAGDATADSISCGDGDDQVWYGPTDVFAANDGCERKVLLAF